MSRKQTLRERFARLLHQRGRYQAVFDNGDGPWVLSDLMRANNVFQPTATKQGDGVAQALDTAFREGQRAAILRILTILRYDDATILEMERSIEDQLEGLSDDN